MRAQACRCAGPRRSPSSASPVAVCHSRMRSAGVGTGDPPDRKRFTLPLEAAVRARGHQHWSVPAGNVFQPPALARGELGADDGNRRGQPQPRAESLGRIAVQEERASAEVRADFGGHRFRLARMAAAHDDPGAARRESARARLAAASRTLAGSGGASGMPTRRPGHDRTGGSASARTIGCGTISARSGMERDSLSSCRSPHERAAPAASAVSGTGSPKRSARLATSPASGRVPPTGVCSHASTRPAIASVSAARAQRDRQGFRASQANRRRERDEPAIAGRRILSQASNAAGRSSSHGSRPSRCAMSHRASGALSAAGRQGRARRTPTHPGSSRPQRPERSVPRPIFVMETPPLDRTTGPIRDRRRARRAGSACRRRSAGRRRRRVWA